MVFVHENPNSKARIRNKLGILKKTSKFAMASFRIFGFLIIRIRLGFAIFGFRACPLFYLNVFHPIHAGDFDFFKAPAIFHWRGGIDTQAGGDTGFRT
jgi:hypothetical protein